MLPNYSGRIKILVTLRKSLNSNDEYKKMMVVMNGTDKVYALKRTIEREFLDLFPTEQPYVVAKIEDQNGYSLSNQSNVEDFIQNGQIIYAMPERLVYPHRTGAEGESVDEVAIHGGSNALELVQML